MKTNATQSLFRVSLIAFTVALICASASADDKYHGNRNRGNGFTGISISPAGVGFAFQSNGFGIAVAPGTIRNLQQQGFVGDPYYQPVPYVAPTVYQPVPVAPPAYPYPYPQNYPQPGFNQPPAPTPIYQGNTGFGPSPTPAASPEIQKPVPSVIDQPVPPSTPSTQYRQVTPELRAPNVVLAPQQFSGQRMYSVLEN